MMLDCKKNTKQNRYNFIFSIGFWVNNLGALISNEFVLSQALMVEGFTVDHRFEENQKNVIRFSEDTFKFTYSCWEEKIKTRLSYEKYLEEINQISEKEAEREALKALSHIQTHEKNGDISEIATIWSVVEQKWVMSNLNHSVN